MELNKEAVRAAEKEEDLFDLKLPLQDPMPFDGEEIRELDLSGLIDLTAMDMAAIDRQMQIMGYSYARPEVTGMYAMLVAARVNHKPWEYCNKMKARDFIRLRETIRAFFYAQG